MDKMPTFDHLLEKESEFYDRFREELLLKYPNRFLLIHGEKVEGNFDTEAAAIAAGINKFGSGPFLVRQSGEYEPVFSAPSLTLGLFKKCQ